MQPYYCIDPSAGRIDKNHFPTAEEACAKAAECARILGRAIRVFSFTDGKKVDYAMVNPDGSYDVTTEVPTANPMLPEGTKIMPTAPFVLGSVLDEVAEQLETRGSKVLAAVTDTIRAEVTAAPKPPTTFDEFRKALAAVVKPTSKELAEILSYTDNMSGSVVQAAYNFWTSLEYDLNRDDPDAWPNAYSNLHDELLSMFDGLKNSMDYGPGQKPKGKKLASADAEKIADAFYKKFGLEH